MRISREKIRKLCGEKKINIRQALAGAGVSRNAFYTLARKRNILPHSIVAMADFLGVAPTDLLDAGCSTVEKVKRLGAAVDRIAKLHKDVDRENVRHVLQLLEEQPVDRLRRALTRAQRFNFR